MKKKVVIRDLTIRDPGTSRAYVEWKELRSKMNRDDYFELLKFVDRNKRGCTRYGLRLTTLHEFVCQ